MPTLLVPNVCADSQVPTELPEIWDDAARLSAVAQASLAI
jgi:hypothetical protein